MARNPKAHAIGAAALSLALMPACGGEGSPADATGDGAALEDADAAEGDTDANAEAGGAETTTPDGDAPADASPPPPPTLERATSCSPEADPCAPSGTVDGLRATYRKPRRLDNSVHPEDIDPPDHGGRLHVAGVAQASGAITEVRIDGKVASSIHDPAEADEPDLQWYHVWPRPAEEGEALWVAFHSVGAEWDEQDEASLRVETEEGVALDGTFPIQRTEAPITYVTTDRAMETLLVHVDNEADEARTIDRILVRGRDVTGAGAACVPVNPLPPGEATLVEVPLCEATEAGAAWTVSVDYADAPTAVGVGRVLPPRYPIGAWQNTNECPFPGNDEDNAESLREAGIEGLYMHAGTCAPSNCDCDGAQLIGETLADDPDLLAWAADGLASRDFASTAGLMAFSTGDESEWDLWEGDGTPTAANKAEDAREIWKKYPEVPTFNGGFTHNHIGHVAGMTDIQGIDHYNSACAPHITEFGNHPPPRAPYDYLRNARDNHLPGPTWLYTQGLHAGWNFEDVNAGEEVHAQPDPQEIVLQALSVPAAGGKGLLWFQVNQDEAAHAPERWQAITDVNWMIRGVRHWLREGDITGMVEAPDDVIAEVVRARDALVLILINLRPDPEVPQPTDTRCLEAQARPDEVPVPHHVFAERTATVTVDVPPDLPVRDLFEVRPKAVRDLPWTATRDGRAITLQDVPLSNDPVGRILVLAADEDARAEARSAMGVDE